MKHKVEITYEWWDERGNDVRKGHREALEKSAMSRIKEMMVEGYTAGDLQDTMYVTDEYGEYEVEYSGWWSMTTTNC